MSATKEELKKYEGKLRALKESLEKKLSEFKKNPDLGSDVDHFEEEEDEAEELANRLGVEQSLKDQLEEIENALQKIADNAYGRCENCGNEIDKNLLEVNPESKFCKSCKISGIEN